MKKIIFGFLSVINFSLLPAQPLDGVVKREVFTEKMPLSYVPLREADIMWERRIWQVIDVREKQNQPIMYPDRPLFEIVKEAVEDEDLIVYGTENDKFTQPLLKEEVIRTFYTSDTVTVFDPNTHQPRIEIIQNEINIEDIKRFRIKEVWFFNSKTSQLDVRIIGMAPMIDVEDERGNFLYEQPLFWIYFPDLRHVLAKEQVFNTNSGSLISWDDWFEQRRFSSTIYKENNVTDRRLKDYLVGRDLLLEADKIKNEIFDFEQDFWSR